MRASLTAELAPASQALARTGPPAWLAAVDRPRRAPLRSLVASVNALFRFVETHRPAGERILADRYAEDLAEGTLLQIVRYARFLVPPLHRVVSELQTAHCVRHAAIDTLTMRAVERERYRQVVVLGAGYDMRPSRFARRLRDVSWYEVDLPAMSDRKRALVAALPRTHKGVSYVAADLGQGALLPRLEAAGFRPDLPACFVLEGLIHYLRLDGLDRLLGEVTAGEGARRIVFSFIRSDIYLAASPIFRSLVRLVREIPRLHFTWSDLAQVCARHGLRRFEAWTYPDQVRAFAPAARGRRVGGTQDVGQVARGT